jgi:hypothetical protein
MSNTDPPKNRKQKTKSMSNTNPPKTQHGKLKISNTDSTKKPESQPEV